MTTATMRGPDLLLLTEDSAADAHSTLETLVKKTCRLVEARCQSHRVTIRPANDDARRALRGNVWKERKKAEPGRREAYTQLLEAIATTVCVPSGYVLFHVDGDRTWTDRATSENIAAFHREIVDGVRRTIERFNQETERKQLSRAMHDVDACMAKLIPLVPFYSIEAWLYQSTKRAKEICARDYRGRDVPQFDAWERNPEVVDDVGQVKVAVCLGGRHNVELARAFDAAYVERVGKSYAATVARVRAAPGLSSALAATASQP